MIKLLDTVSKKPKVVFGRLDGKGINRTAVIIEPDSPHHPLVRLSDGNPVYSTFSIFPLQNLIIATDKGHPFQSQMVMYSTPEQREWMGFQKEYTKKELERLVEEERVSAMTCRISPPDLKQDLSDTKFGFNKASPITCIEDIVYLRPGINKKHEDGTNRPSETDIEMLLRSVDLLGCLDQPILRQNINLVGMYPEVWDALEKRGELWMIAPRPRTEEEVTKSISESKDIPSPNSPIYYWNMGTGTRWMTYTEFFRLGERAYDPSTLATALSDIQVRVNLDKKNNGYSSGKKEIAFFKAPGFNLGSYQDSDFNSMPPSELIQVYTHLRGRFHQLVDPSFIEDNIHDDEWREAMLEAIVTNPDKRISIASVLGLSPEFATKIRWLPGMRSEDGILTPDPVFNQNGNLVQANKPYDEKVLPIIDAIQNRYNPVDFGQIEYINVGKIDSSISKRHHDGRREEYFVSFKLASRTKRTLKVVRLLKTNPVEIVEAGETDIDKAYRYGKGYKRNVQNREKACRLLGMSLAPGEYGSLDEVIDAPDKENQGRNRGYHIELNYRMRDYLSGTATCRVGKKKLIQETEGIFYSSKFARLLGEAAAPALITGRVRLNGNVLFDDGDEIVQEGHDNMPQKILVTELSATFGDYNCDLTQFAGAYAQPVIKRKDIVLDIDTFKQEYLEGLRSRFEEIRTGYQTHYDAFRQAFNSRTFDPGNTYKFIEKWHATLDRLERTDINQFINQVSAHIDQALGVTK